MSKKKNKKPSIKQQLMETVKVPLEWVEAPVWKRIIAFAFDMSILMPISYYFLEKINKGLPFIFITLYFIGLEASPWKGTVGKQIMSMKVIDVKKGKVTVGRLVVRYVVKFLSLLFLGTGYWLPLSYKWRPLPDLVSQTMVIALTPVKSK